MTGCSPRLKPSTRPCESTATAAIGARQPGGTFAQSSVASNVYASLPTVVPITCLLALKIQSVPARFLSRLRLLACGRFKTTTPVACQSASSDLDFIGFDDISVAFRETHLNCSRQMIPAC